MKATKRKPKRMTLDALRKKIEHLKSEGVLRTGRAGAKMSPFKPIRMTPGATTTEMIRQMRDEE